MSPGNLKALGIEIKLVWELPSFSFHKLPGGCNVQPNMRSSPPVKAVRGGLEGGAVEQLCRETMTNAVNGEANPKIRGEKINLNFGKCFFTNESLP